VTVLGTHVAGSVKDSQTARTWINRSIGGVFIDLGVRLATVTR
jgi:threonine/homoserine/homoserine lactone efflux protein